MSAGSEISHSLAADAGTNTAGVQGRNVGGNTVNFFYSLIANKKPATRATARRSSLASADSTASLIDATYTSSLIDAGNSMMLQLSCRFRAASQGASIFLALYDESNNLIGRTRMISLQGGSSFTDGTSYLSDPEIVDIGPAAKYFPVLVTAPTSSTVDIYTEHL